MQSISTIFKQQATLLKDVKPTLQYKIRSERDELVQNFFNKGVIQMRNRKTKELEKATVKQVALLLRNCPTSDLHAFYKQCENAKDFARFFWWSIKNKATKK